MTTDAPGTPAAETNITEGLIARLIRDQYPDLAGQPVRIMGAGWDNVMARVGDTYAVRMPRHKIGDRLLRTEQKWLPVLASDLPLPIPEPLYIGAPSGDYPFTWSLVRWLPGETADLAPPDAGEASALAAFLKAVHRSAPKDAPENPVRGCRLMGKKLDTEKRILALKGKTDLLTDRLRQTWETGLETEMDVPKTWIAGDVHAQNVLVQNGKLSAFIDWGDMCVGDRATDLASIWMLFDDPHARQAAIDAYGMSKATLARAKGWAVFFGVILLETGLKDSPQHAAIGAATLRRLNDDALT